MLQETEDIQRSRARLRRIRCARANHWHAVRVGQPNTEFKVRKALDDMEVATVLPTVERWRVRPGSRHKVRGSFPVFSGYVFVGFSHAPNWLDVYHIQPGPVVAVGDREPWILSQKDLAYLQALEGGDIEPAGAVKVGTHVTVSDGHWAQGHAGTVEAMTGDCVRISIPFLGSLRPIKLHLSMLSAA